MKTVLVAIEEFAQSSNRPFEILRDAGFNILTNDTGLPIDKNFVRSSMPKLIMS